MAENAVSENQTTDSDLVYKVARVIFEMERDFDAATPLSKRLSDRHFKVAIMLYESMAREAIAVVRQWDAGK